MRRLLRPLGGHPPRACLPGAHALRARLVTVQAAIDLHRLYRAALPDLWPAAAPAGHLPLGDIAFPRALALALRALGERLGCALRDLDAIAWEEEQEYDYWLQGDDDERRFPFIPSWWQAIPVEGGALAYVEPPADASALERLLYAVLRDDSEEAAQQAARALDQAAISPAVRARLGALLRPSPLPRLASTARSRGRVPDERGHAAAWMAQAERLLVALTGASQPQDPTRGETARRAPIAPAPAPPDPPQRGALVDLPLFARYLAGTLPNIFVCREDMIDPWEAAAFSWSAEGVVQLRVAWDDARRTVERAGAVQAALATDPDAAALLADLLACAAPPGGGP